jgi:hypothetical protein
LVKAHLALEEAEATLAAKRKEVRFRLMARELGATIEPVPTSKFLDVKEVVQA